METASSVIFFLIHCRLFLFPAFWNLIFFSNNLVSNKFTEVNASHVPFIILPGHKCTSSKIESETSYWTWNIHIIHNFICRMNDHNKDSGCLHKQEYVLNWLTNKTMSQNGLWMQAKKKKTQMFLSGEWAKHRLKCDPTSLWVWVWLWLTPSTIVHGINPFRNDDCQGCTNQQSSSKHCYQLQFFLKPQWHHYAKI